MLIRVLITFKRHCVLIRYLFPVSLLPCMMECWFMWAFPVCFVSVVSVMFQSMHLTEVRLKHYNLPLPFSSPLPAHTHTLKLSQRPLQLSLPKRFVLAPSPLQGCYRVSFAVGPHPLPRPLLLINGRAWVVLYPPLAATVLETLHYEEAPLLLPWARTYSQPWLRLEKGVSGSSPCLLYAFVLLGGGTSIVLQEGSSMLY